MGSKHKRRFNASLLPALTSLTSLTSPRRHAGNARFSNKGSTKESIAALKASMPSGGKSQSEYGDVSVADELATRHRQRAAQIVALQSAMATDQKALVAALRRAGVAK